MRTTLNIADDTLKLVREFSRERSLGLGEAASELIRRGAQSRVPTRMVNGFVVFDIAPGGPKITTARVRQLESELE
jgi:hypothetical protein